MSVDVMVLGEALVDFLPLEAGKPVRAVDTWRRFVGGAPANVAVGLARLGARVAMTGVTGQDEFGHFLKEALAREGVDVLDLRQTPDGKTGLGFISLTSTGERSFTFYRAQAAEYLLGPEDVRPERLAAAKVLHLGTNSLLEARAREAVWSAVQAARGAGRLVSCDPNLRLHLWKDPSVLRTWLDRLVGGLDVLKLSSEEIEFVAGTSEVDLALERLRARGPWLVAVTLGAEGAAVRLGERTFRVGAPRVDVVDTTGAGDGFMTGLLFGLTRLLDSPAGLRSLDPGRLEPVARLACEIGSRVVTRLGAVAALPTRAEALPWLQKANVAAT